MKYAFLFALVAAVIVVSASAKTSTVSTISLNANGCSSSGVVSFTLQTPRGILYRAVPGGCPAHIQRTSDFPVGNYRFRVTQCVNHDYYWSPWGSFYLTSTGGAIYFLKSNMLVEPNFC